MKTLSIDEMLNVLGGAAEPTSDYCEALDMIIDENWEDLSPEQQIIAVDNWNKYCV